MVKKLNIQKFYELVSIGKDYGDLAETFGFSESSARRHVLMYGLEEEYKRYHPAIRGRKKIPEYERIDRRSVLDSLIGNNVGKASSLEQIGEILGVNRKRAQQILYEEGKHEIWKVMRGRGRYKNK